MKNLQAITGIVHDNIDQNPKLKRGFFNRLHKKSRVMFSWVSYLLLSICILFCSNNNLQAQFTGYGNGATPSITSGYVDNIRARIDTYSGTTIINIDHVQGTFTAGQVVLIIDMETCSGGKNWEFNVISSVTLPALTLQYNLQNTYTKAQVIQVPQYPSLTISGNITCQPYDQNPTSTTYGTGGVIVMLVNGTLTISSTGKIDADKKGFSHKPNITTGKGGIGGQPGDGATLVGADAGDGAGWPATGIGSGNGSFLGYFPDNSNCTAELNNCCDCSIGLLVPAFNASFIDDPELIVMGGAGQSGDGGLGKIGAGGAGSGCEIGYPGGDGTQGGNGGDGGDGAAGGGIILIKAKSINNNGLISTIGGDAQPGDDGTVGGDGGDAALNSGAGGGWAGWGGDAGYGGSGGAGGLIYIISTSAVSYDAATMLLDGGYGGIGGSDGARGSHGYSDIASCVSPCPAQPTIFYCTCPKIWDWINNAAPPTVDGTGHEWTFIVNSAVTCIATTSPGKLDIVCKEEFCPPQTPVVYNTYICAMVQQVGNDHSEDIDLARYQDNPPVKQTYSATQFSVKNYSDDAQTILIDSYKDSCYSGGGGCCPVGGIKDGLDGLPGKFGSNTEPDPDPDQTVVYVKTYLEGPYNLFTHAMDPALQVTDPSAEFDDVDFLEISVMDPNTFTPVAAQTGRLKINGEVSVTFTGSVAVGNSYYLRIRHRNSIETWSRFPVLFSTVVFYDFSVSSSQAYDDGFSLPMKLVESSPPLWALFSGDVNQDGTVDAYDMTLEENFANIGAFGYLPTDVNGDGSSDALDMTFIEGNSYLGVFTAHP